MASTGDPPNNRIIALVEDDPDVTALVQGLAEGHELTCFADGAEAVEALTGDSPRPHVILLDLDLPTMHGLKVLERLRQHPRTSRVPVVIFTATTMAPDEGYRLGANAWVQKSSNADDLASSISSVLAFWTGLNQPSTLLHA